MSRAEMRDELARAMGWKLVPMSGWINNGNVRLRIGDDGHPVPETLDFIASALPDGYEWRYGYWGGGEVTFVACRKGDDNELDRTGPTEYDARLAACLAAWKALKGAADE